jgi:hypothetical protein
MKWRRIQQINETERTLKNRLVKKETIERDESTSLCILFLESVVIYICKPYSGI